MLIISSIALLFLELTNHVVISWRPFGFCLITDVAISP